MPQSHMILANTEVALGDLSDAIAQYRQTVRLAPQWSEASTRLSQLLAKSSDFEGHGK
jgi:cytochrome c-type biogenesis protein CcmH/NrfG